MKLARVSQTYLEQRMDDLQDSMGRVNRARLTSFLGGIAVIVLLFLSLPILLPLWSTSSGIMRVTVPLDLALFVLLAFLLLAMVPCTLRKVVVDFNRKIAEDKRARKAEKEVQAVLGNLDERQYAVFHGLYRGYGDIDHIVVGPTGAFIIETKSNRGDVSVDEFGRLVIDHGDRPHKSYRQQAVQEAYQVKDYLAAHGVREQLFVQPVLAFPFASVPDGLHLGDIKTGSYIPVLGTKAILQYIYQHKASGSITPDLVERCRVALQQWADNPDEETLEGMESG
jgi:hypothetical protein